MIFSHNSGVSVWCWTDVLERCFLGHPGPVGPDRPAQTCHQSRRNRPVLLPYLLLLSGPTALERFAFGRNLSEVFGAALGIFPSGKPARFRKDEFPGNGLIAMWAFHVSRVLHSLQFGNREKCIRSCKQYRQLNAERISEAQKEQYRKNPQLHIERVTRRYRTKRSEVLAHAKKYYVKVAERVKARQKQNRPHIREVERKYYQLHPGASLAKANRRRARQAGAQMSAGPVVRLAYDHIKNTHGLRCYWCSKPVPIRARHVDHIIPLARGGSHTPSNLCCSCSSCNLAKGAKLPEEFRNQGELHLT